MVKPSFWIGWASPKQSAVRDFPSHHERIEAVADEDGEASGELEVFSALQMPVKPMVTTATRAKMGVPLFFTTDVTMSGNVANRRS